MAVPSSNIKIAQLGGNRVQDPYEAERLRLAEQAARKAGANNQPVVNQPQYSYLKDNQGNATNVLDPRKTPGIGEAMTVEQAQKQGLLGVPQSKPLESLSDVVKQTKQTYAEQADSQLRGQFLTEYQNAQKYGIELPYKTFEDYKAYKDSGFASDKAYLEKQQGISRGLEASQAATAMEQLGGAQRAVTASMAQSREGAMGSSKPQFVAEFSTQIQRQRDQIVAQRESAELERTRAMEELKRAKESGDIALAKAIQGQLSAIETNIRQIDSQALEAATLANEQALKAMQFELDKSTTEQATQRANLTTFTDLVNQGVELSPDSLINFASSLNVPFEAAYSYYQGAKQIREDKTLDAEGKRIANQQNLQNLNDQITGANIASVKQWQIIENMYKNGATKEEISRAKDAFGFKDKDDKAYQLDLRIKEADVKLKEMMASGELPYGSTDWLQRESLKLDLAQKQRDYYDQYGGQWDAGVFRIGQEVGWCGDYASTISTASRVGDLWSEKRKVIDDKNITVGDKLLIPLGGADGYGHVAVVLGYDPVTGDIQVAESNKDGRQNRKEGLGIATFGNYNVNDLNAQFGSDWGVAHGELKEQYRNAFNQQGGQQIYSNVQIKVLESLSGISPKDIDGTTLDILKKAKLTTNDLLSYSPEKQVLAPEKQKEVTDILTEIQRLKNMDMTGAVGASLQKVLPGVSAKSGFIPGTDAANFKAQFDKFRDSLVLPSLDKFKGAMSDKDIQFLRNAATALNLDMSEEAFMAELNKLEQKYREVLGDSTMSGVDPIALYQSIQQDYSMGMDVGTMNEIDLIFQ